MKISGRFLYVLLDVFIQFLFQSAGILSSGESIDDVHGRCEEDGMTIEACLVTDSRGEVIFS
jgi:hypothetical protein